MISHLPAWMGCPLDSASPRTAGLCPAPGSAFQAGCVRSTRGHRTRASGKEKEEHGIFSAWMEKSRGKSHTKLCRATRDKAWPRPSVFLYGLKSVFSRPDCFLTASHASTELGDPCGEMPARAGSPRPSNSCVPASLGVDSPW